MPAPDGEGQHSSVMKIQEVLPASHPPAAAVTSSSSSTARDVHQSTASPSHNTMITSSTNEMTEKSMHSKTSMDKHSTMETTTITTVNAPTDNDTSMDARELENGYDDTTKTPVEQMSWKRSLILFSGLALTVFLCSLDQTIVATAIPRIASDFNGLNDVSWIGSAYLLSTAAVTPLYGKLTAIFGLKPVFLFALTMFLAGSLGCALSSSMVMLIIFRALSGIGGESMYALALVIITAIFAISAAIGPLLGGVFTDHATWRWAFYINLPIGAISAVIIIFGFHHPTIQGSMLMKLKRIDYPGPLLCVAVVVCGAFIWVEGHYAKEPFIPGRVLNSRNAILSMSTSFLAGWVIFTLVYYFPLFYQLVRNKTATQAGLMLIPLMIMCCISTGISTLVIGRFGAWTYPSILAGGFSIVVLALGLSLTFWETAKMASEVVILLIAGIGLGTVWQSVFLTAQASSDVKDIAVSTMLCSFFQMMGATIGLAVSGSVFNNAMAKYIPVDGMWESSGGGHGVIGSLDGVHDLPPDVQAQAIHGIIKAFHILFISLIPVAVLAIICGGLVRPRRWSEVQAEAGPTGGH
ncbi:major facilitator superfamily domain-containing protein [Syncephalis plumigaleata]|nr:major facilitator superfamily domain-containing protein [Syncephalis plumigaleata]